MTRETWKDIPGFEGRYQAHPDGRIRTLRWMAKKAFGDLVRPQTALNPSKIRELKQREGKGGYYRVSLGSGNVRLVHHVILETFIGPKPEGLECNHTNGIKSDNSLKNLEWVTRSANYKHAYDTGLRVVTEAQREAGRQNVKKALPVELARRRAISGNQ